MRFFVHIKRCSVVATGWRILHHHVITASLTMMKIANISTKNENDAFRFDTYIKHDIDITIVKITLIAPILTTKIEVATGTFFHLI